MTREEKVREIAIKAYKQIEEIYKNAWKEIDDYFDDEYEQQYSYPHLNQLDLLFHNGKNSVNKEYFKINKE